ncbi:pro-neuropeptide Y-like [Helicoverpa zea]|uniref:pro-neuropeptide Y-like n=1 Tax=Helicoverpa zea TaxID=7113 RepID=UPI000B372BED|nr:pro-neuropeptide Y [Helicoverpa armigera]XP_047038436.1 pro-neuropeptide Y-like [Helicoverpa zea]XP_049698439.1 pro-neuropeptide Y [Helicoverpa armigera]WGD18935.1 neuropeptide F 2 [Helicoverpa armigera]
MRFLLPAMLLLSAILSCAAQAQYPRPRRPERFDTAEQISNYLKELQEYYSVHGRGRYGKRQMHIADASVIFRESPFFEHNLNDEPAFKNLGYK